MSQLVHDVHKALGLQATDAERQLRPKQQHMPLRTRLCNHFAKGFCAHLDCGFAHGIQELGLIRVSRATAIGTDSDQHSADAAGDSATFGSGFFFNAEAPEFQPTDSGNVPAAADVAALLMQLLRDGHGGCSVRVPDAVKAEATQLHGSTDSSGHFAGADAADVDSDTGEAVLQYIPYRRFACCPICHRDDAECLGNAAGSKLCSIWEPAVDNNDAKAGSSQLHGPDADEALPHGLAPVSAEAAATDLLSQHQTDAAAAVAETAGAASCLTNAHQAADTGAAVGAATGEAEADDDSGIDRLEQLLLIYPEAGYRTLYAMLKQKHNVPLKRVQGFAARWRWQCSHGRLIYRAGSYEAARDEAVAANADEATDANAVEQSAAAALAADADTGGATDVVSFSVGIWNQMREKL